MDKLNQALQENILVLLCYHKKYIPLIINSIPVDLFESSIYRAIATKAIQFYQQFKKPIADHLPDEFDSILNPQKETKKSLSDVKLYGMVFRDLYEVKDSVNSDYVISQLGRFVRLQNLKQGIIKAHEAIQKGDLEKAEDVWESSTKKSISVFDEGARFNKFSNVVASLSVDEEYFDTGIKELDCIKACPARKDLMIIASLPGFGKSQFMVLVGKVNVLQQRKVLHISLEMYWKKVFRRYLQAFFSISREQSKIMLQFFELDNQGKFENIREEYIKAPLHFSQKDIYQKLKKKMLGLKLGRNLIIKDFPSGSLTIRSLKAYLENLINYSKFHPDLIILDSAYLMFMDSSKLRIDLGRNLVLLRGLAGEYNCGLITGVQLNREGKKADTHWLDERFLSEDFSPIMTADVIVSYNQTYHEYEKKLARMLVVKNRDSLKGRKVMVSQAFDIGQFTIDSLLMPNSAMLSQKYWKAVKGEKE